MTYFEKNIHAGDSIADNLDLAMSAVRAVVSNSTFSLECEQTEKHDETFCRSLYTLIGACEAMLASFPEESREKGLGFAGEYFSGEYDRKREESRDEAVRSTLKIILG